MNIDLYVFIHAYMSQRQEHTKNTQTNLNNFFLNILKIRVNVNTGETCAAEVTVGTSILTS